MGRSASCQYHSELYRLKVEIESSTNGLGAYVLQINNYNEAFRVLIVRCVSKHGSANYYKSILRRTFEKC